MTIQVTALLSLVNSAGWTVTAQSSLFGYLNGLTMNCIWDCPTEKIISRLPLIHRNARPLYPTFKYQRLCHLKKEGRTKLTKKISPNRNFPGGHSAASPKSCSSPFMWFH